MSEARATAAPGPQLQRVGGTGRLVLAHRAGRTRLAGLHQAGSAKIRLPRRAADPVEAVLINTAGGLTGGDRLDWRIELGASCRSVVTTQAAEKLYRSCGGAAHVATRIRLDAGARLAWLPQETIAFEGSGLRRTIEVEMEPDARLVMSEAYVVGRTAMGERVTRGSLADRWRVRQAGRLVHAEAFSLRGQVDRVLSGPASAGGKTALATLLYVGPDADALLATAREQLVASAGHALGGASAWEGKLVARLVAPDGLALRRALLPLAACLCGEAGLGVQAFALPRLLTQ